MARLNEVPASTESIESLKRRFLRQNRDIARVNSTQSLRIRNLENETSRLLAENLGLQEQILRLQSDLTNRQGQRLTDHTQDVKSQLEVKLLEIGAIINTLQDDPPPKKKSPRVETTTKTSPTGSPDQRNWRNICTLGEAIGGQDGRLPTIVEHKSYPRKTFEHRELVDIILDADTGADTTGSPDIGPPPVSQFVDEDPVRIDLPQRSHKEEVGEPIGVDPILSINMEQRKKPKDISSSTGPNQAMNARPAQRAQESKASLKTGAKRKFSVREDEAYENRAGFGVDSSPDNFEFTRVINDDKMKDLALPPEKSGMKLTRELAVARGATREKRSSTGISTSRKALAPKSANDSPRKTTKAQLQDEMKPKKPDVPNFNPLKERSSEKESKAVSIRPQIELLQNTTVPKRGSETLVGVGILSPPSSRQSTARAESRDTPPPPDLEGHRPSRRARGAVSYAEPNLRDKMRRPTKELADAVTGDSNSRRSISSKQAEDQALNQLAIKAELEGEDAWKRMPLASSSTVENSPFRSKVPGSESDALPSSITTHRKRRESILHHVERDPNKSGSETAISALIAEHRKVKAAAREKVHGKEGNLAKAMEKLDVYDFNGSSSPQAPATKAIKERNATSKSTRRQSSTPRDLETVGNSEASDIEVPKAREVSVSRRRQSTLGLKNLSTNGQSASEKQLPAKEHLNSTGMADLAAGDTRGDRILARRRSMML